MTVALNELFRLTEVQAKPAAEMLACAFLDNPGLIYYYPDASERRGKSFHFLRWMICYGCLYGEAYATSPNLEGVAVWLPSEKVHMTAWRIVRSGGLSMMLKLGRKSASQVISAGNYMTSIHKRHAPFRHWYLYGLGVNPEHQGKGHASSLLKAMFVRIDKEGLPCYLETQNERNVPIYQHYGFKVVEESVIPGTEVTNWAMLREKVGWGR